MTKRIVCICATIGSSVFLFLFYLNVEHEERYSLGSIISFVTFLYKLLRAKKLLKDVEKAISCDKKLWM